MRGPRLTLGLKAAGRHLVAGMALILSLPWLLSAVHAQPQDAGVQVIAHPSVDGRFLNRDYLRSVFTLRVRTWPDGEPVRVFVLEDASAVHGLFSREVLGTFPYVLRRTWDRTTFAGTGLVPEQVESLEEMRRKVLSTPGGVGYMPTRQAEGNVRNFRLAGQWGGNR